MSKKTRVTLAIVLGALFHLIGYALAISAFAGFDIEPIWNGTFLQLVFFILMACFFFSCYHLIRSGILPKIVRNILIYMEIVLVLTAILFFASLVYNA